jgi:hypothetical protein
MVTLPSRIWTADAVAARVQLAFIHNLDVVDAALATHECDEPKANTRAGQWSLIDQGQYSHKRHVVP